MIRINYPTIAVAKPKQKIQLHIQKFSQSRFQTSKQTFNKLVEISKQELDETIQFMQDMHSIIKNLVEEQKNKCNNSKNGGEQ